MSTTSNIFFPLLILPLFSACQQLTTYPLPEEGFDHCSSVYTIKINQGQVISKSCVYVSHAGSDMSQKEWGYQQNKSFHYTIFSFSGTITITVTKNNSTATTAIIRPSASGIGTINTIANAQNRSVTFKLAQAGKFSVEFDDDPGNKEALMLFADLPENPADVPDIHSAQVWKVNASDKNLVVPTDKSIVYFGPGIYEPGYFEIPPYVKQVYIAGGAFVRGYFFAERKDDAALQINGRGILSNDKWPFHYPANTAGETDYAKWYKMIKITGGSNHRIEGITLIDPSANIIALYSSSHITIENIKVNAFRYNNDALNLHGDYNIINNCFFRSNEDVIGINGNNTSIMNCSFWQLHNGSIIQLGWTPHNIGKTIIKDCTILHAEWDNDQNHNLGFINVMNTTAPNSNAIMENFTVSNIFADTDILRFIDLRMLRNGKGQPLNIRNFTFDNIHLKTNKLNTPLFYMAGYDATHTISNITFSNIYVNDKPVYDLFKNAALFNVDKFSEAPVFKQ